MPLNLPEPVLQALRDRYRAGVAEAQTGFSLFRSSEDALTGALGWELSRRPEFVVPVGGIEYAVKVDFYKPRSSGLNSPERLYGTDGIFQIEIADERGRIVGMKGLPFQAKTDWRGTNNRLANQCVDINKSLHGGIVVNFKRSGYEACTTRAAADAAGEYGLVKQTGQIKPLAQILANDFLDCTVGTVGLFFDSDAERFVGAGGSQMVPANAITTVIRKRRR